MVLLRFTTHYACAGAVFNEGRCTQAAPILKWALGKTKGEVKRIATQKGWTWEYVEDDDGPIW